jgi:hypothetical protein
LHRLDAFSAVSARNRLGWAKKRIFIFNFYVDSTYVGKLYTSLNPASDQDYVLLNGKTTYRLGKLNSLLLSGDNLADADYQMQYGYPMPGAAANTGIRFSSETGTSPLRHHSSFNLHSNYIENHLLYKKNIVVSD